MINSRLSSLPARRWYVSTNRRRKRLQAAMANRAIPSNAGLFLRTPRLGFRQWSINDLPLALDLWGDPEVSRFLGGPFSPEAIEEKLTKEIATLGSHQIQYWPIFLLANNHHVGGAGFGPDKPQKTVFQLGY